MTTRSISSQGAGLPGPNFKLPRRLMHKHFHSGNHFRTRRPGQFHEPRLRRIVDHFENVARLDFILIQRRLLRVAHTNWRSVDDDVETHFLQIGPLQSPCPRRARQFLSCRETTIQNIYFCAALLESEYSGARGAARAQNQYFRPVDCDSLL